GAVCCLAPACGGPGRGLPWSGLAMGRARGDHSGDVPMASMASTSSTSARRPRRRDVLCCWLCGMTGPGCVPDVHYAPRSLCVPCRRTAPVAGHRQSRSASALTVLLGLGPAWRMGWRRVLVHRVAARYGVLAWDDTPPTV